MSPRARERGSRQCLSYNPMRNHTDLPLITRGVPRYMRRATRLKKMSGDQREWTSLRAREMFFNVATRRPGVGKRIKRSLARRLRYEPLTTAD